jgi:peptidoglycan/xylan/chitin deacetylase (PgdA/CDA1 family)
MKPLDRFETKEKIVALTFDDGPARNCTPPLLDLLKRYAVRATFFVVGERVERYNNKETVKREIREGHLIGEHSYRHDIMIFHSFSFIKNDVKRMDDLLLSLGASNLSFYRPPTGCKMIILPLVLRSMNKTLVMWNVQPPEQYIYRTMSEEFKSQYATALSQYVIDKCQPGSIILFHDGWWGDEVPMMRALEQIIVELKKRGYRFVTIQEGLDMTKGQSH